MAAFAELDWARFDVWAAVAMEGVAVVKSEHREVCLVWLRQHDYAVTSIDFALGVSPAVFAPAILLIPSAATEAAIAKTKDALLFPDSIFMLRFQREC